jgi:hypothetical protein
MQRSIAALEKAPEDCHVGPFDNENVCAFRFAIAHRDVEPTALSVTEINSLDATIHSTVCCCSG